MCRRHWPMSCLWMQWWPAYRHRRLSVLPPNWPIMKSNDNKVCLSPYLYDENKTVVLKSLVFIPTVPMIIPRPTAEALKHKINPSQNMTNPQSVDVLLYTPGLRAGVFGEIVKWIVHLKITILSLITQPHVIPNHFWMNYPFKIL